MLLAGGLVMATFLGVIGIAILALAAGACPNATTGTGDQPSLAAKRTVPDRSSISGRRRESSSSRWSSSKAETSAGSFTKKGS